MTGYFVLSVQNSVDDTRKVENRQRANLQQILVVL